MAFTDSIKNYFKETGSISRRRFKKFVLAAPFWILIISIGLIAAGLIRYNTIRNYTYDRKTAGIWAQDGTLDFRHVSVFSRGARESGSFSPSIYVDTNISLGRTDILDIRKSLQDIADSALPGNKKTGLNEDGTPRGWEDCFSTFMDMTFTYSSDEVMQPVTVDTEVVAVEGNYRAFHPFTYMSGGFLPETCVDTDQIVINDVLAWKLFSSYDVTGKVLEAYGRRFTIIGVVAERTDSLNRSVGSMKPRAYIYFRTLESIMLSPDKPEMLNITTYEAMLPELVKGVARADIINALPNYNAADPKLYVVSNTDRYSVLSVWDFMMPLGETQTMLDGYEFPYWERAAQLVTMHLYVDIILVSLGGALLLIGVVTSVLRWKKIEIEPVKEEVEEASETVSS